MPKSLWSAVPAAKEQNVRNFWDGDEIVFSPKVSAQVETDG